MHFLWKIRSILDWNKYLENLHGSFNYLDFFFFKMYSCGKYLESSTLSSYIIHAEVCSECSICENVNAQHYLQKNALICTLIFTKELIQIREHNKFGGGNRLYAQGKTKHLLSWIRLAAFFWLNSLLVPELSNTSSLMTKSHLVSAILPLQSFAYIKGSYSASLKTLVHFCVYLDIMDGWIEGRRNENILFICIVYCGIGIYVSMYMCVCIYAYKYIYMCVYVVLVE